LDEALHYRLLFERIKADVNSEYELEKSALENREYGQSGY